MLPRFTQFIRERQYLRNVSSATIHWYTHAFNWLLPCANPENPTEDELKSMVLRMRERGLKATGANAACRAINAYLKWAGSPHHVRPMKEPQLILPTFTAAQVSLLAHWKPHGFYERRLHMLVLILLDTGCRISEALSIRVVDCDLDNLLVTLDGKGRKQRKVPFSLELRRHLFRYMREYPHDLLLTTRAGSPVERSKALHYVKQLCKRLGFTPPPRTLHAFRHTFAVNYIRRGGSVFHLQKVLGHSSLEMTRRYANMQTEDLQAIHERVSLLRSVGMNPSRPPRSIAPSG